MFAANTKLFKYTLVPDWLKKQPRDPFDYKLRSKAEVIKDQKYFPPNFYWTNEVTRYPAGDVREDVDARIDHRDKTVRLHWRL